jgi:hypothetical protein
MGRLKGAGTRRDQRAAVNDYSRLDWYGSSYVFACIAFELVSRVNVVLDGHVSYASSFVACFAANLLYIPPEGRLALTGDREGFYNRCLTPFFVLIGSRMPDAVMLPTFWPSLRRSFELSYVFLEARAYVLCRILAIAQLGV